MKEGNVRYGVVNTVKRVEYEKEHQKSYGYDYTTRNKEEAISVARKENNHDVIVERVFDTPIASNFKEEIFRSGKSPRKE